MKRTPVNINPDVVPASFRPLLRGMVMDSSCSPAARVYFLPAHGCFLKTAPKGTLHREAQLTRYFHSLQLGPEVLAYESAEADWLLTRQVPGEDCTHPQYLSDPRRLADTTGTLLRALHQQPPAGCPVHRTPAYLRTAQENYERGCWDLGLFGDHAPFASPEEAWRTVEQVAPLLQSDVLLHGDYCLPNIMLDRWRFAGFIDLDSGGRGDRHIDLFWGAWTLQFNLHTDAYRERFLDAYGRDAFDPDMLRAIAAFEVFG